MTGETDMGTRSLTFVYNHTRRVVCMYRQFDGYPSGHGREFAEFLAGFDAVVNGLRVGETRKVANGMGCLAAQLVANFKVSSGGFYLYPTDTSDVGEEYEYHVYADKVVVKDGLGETLFSESWEDFTEYCKDE
jgi:hypothetical protein